MNKFFPSDPPAVKAGYQHTLEERSPLLDEQFVDEAHIEAFAAALAAPDLSSIDSTATTPAGNNSPAAATSALPSSSSKSLSESSPSYSGGGGNDQAGVERVTALSDFAPVNIRVKRRRKIPTRKEGFSYSLVRYPLLFFLLGLIFAEFSVYVFTRQIVNVFEWGLAWTGQKRKLRSKLRRAKTFEEWKTAALEMDELLGFNLWKKEDEDSQYDYSLIKKVTSSLVSFRASNDVRGTVGVLDICLKSSFAGFERSQLYSESFYGTKDLLETYILEVEKSLAFVRSSPELSLQEKRRFFRSASKNFGSSALCLSGGASFGYYHTGVAKALLEQGLLPRVVTGTSAGALIAALICTRHDSELKGLLCPELADRITACEEGFSVWARRVWKTGARFDTVNWARKASFFTHGSLTFREAYERTGRVLNVSVIPHDRHSPTKLLNYLTAPDCVIWSAIIASAAVPGILNPVVLMTKNPTTGAISPFNWGTRFKDGSLRVDIPLQSLHLLFNVNFSLVSQVNPHVHLFFFAPKGSPGRPVAHRKGKGWRGGFVLSAMEQYLKLELVKNFKVIRDLELMPELLGQDWSSVFLQRFDGSLTIWPRTTARDWLHLLTDPDRKELARMIGVGERVTWPKIHMVENRERIEREILLGRQAVRQAISKTSSSANRSPNIDPSSLPPSRTTTNNIIPSSTLRPAVSRLVSASVPLDSDLDSDLDHRRAKIAELESLDAEGGETPRGDSTTDSDDDVNRGIPRSPLPQLQHLSSSFQRLRTQSFPSFQLPWNGGAVSSAANGSGASGGGRPHASRSSSKLSRRSRGSRNGGGNSSSSSEDEDELRDWGKGWEQR